MKEIFEQYGGVLITVTAIITVIGVILLVISGTGDTSKTSAIYTAFNSLITGFVKSVENGDKLEIVIPQVTKSGGFLLMPHMFM